MTEQLAALLREHYPELRPALNKRGIHAAINIVADFNNGHEELRAVTAQEQKKKRKTELLTYIQAKQVVDAKIASVALTDAETRLSLDRAHREFASNLELARAFFKKHRKLVTAATFPAEHLQSLRDLVDWNGYVPDDRIECGDSFLTAEPSLLREQTRRDLRHSLERDLPRNESGQLMTEAEVIDELATDFQAFCENLDKRSPKEKPQRPALLTLVK
ncbi:MAG: hypothetical protein ABI811_22985 [Acidobacteriota bacterium]